MIWLSSIVLLTSFFMAGSGRASGYQVPIPGTEDIPELMAQSSLVCKGEVVKVVENEQARELRERSVTLQGKVAVFRVDRFYKGQETSNLIRVTFFESSNPLSNQLTLTVGEYLLLFLKPDDGNYTFSDRFFGKLPVPKELAPESKGVTDPLQLLERDLEAALVGPTREGVLDAIQMLGNLKKLRSTKVLKDLVLRGDPQINGAVYLALIKLADYSMLTQTGDFFELPNPAAEIRRLQVELSRAIGNIRDETVLAQLQKFTESRNDLLRKAAVTALRTIKSPASVPFLVRRLDDGDADTRYVSMMALALIVQKGNEWAPSRELFDQEEDKYLQLWKEWWLKEGKRNYPAN